MNLKERIAHYATLLNGTAKGTPEHAAYHGIIQATVQTDAKSALVACIQRVHLAIVKLDDNVWPNGHARADAYYARQIELYNVALSEIEE
jgi:hypothetical protein